MTTYYERNEYCCRVESEVHTWKVEVTNGYVDLAAIEVGIIDYYEIKERISTTLKKWLKVFRTTRKGGGG